MLDKGKYNVRNKKKILHLINSVIIIIIIIMIIIIIIIIISIGNSMISSDIWHKYHG